jgi:hypothetical protein
MRKRLIFAGMTFLLLSFTLSSALQVGKGNGKSPILDEDYRQQFAIKSITEISLTEDNQDYYIKGNHQKISFGNSKGLIKAKFVYNKYGHLAENHEYNKKGIRVIRINNFYNNDKQKVRQNENTSSGDSKGKKFFYNENALVDSVAHYFFDEDNKTELTGYTLIQYDDMSRKTQETVVAKNEKSGKLETTTITDYTYKEDKILKDIFYKKFKNKRSEEIQMNASGYITQINSYFGCIKFEYNKAGLLTRETDCTSSDPLDQQVVTYSYDEKNLLIEKEVFNPAQNKSDKYVYSYTFYE